MSKIKGQGPQGRDVAPRGASLGGSASVNNSILIQALPYRPTIATAGDRYGNHMHLAGVLPMKNRPSVMPSTRINKTATKVATNIRRELATESNLRVLEALPAFQADLHLPKKLRRLLDRLDAAEHDKPLRKMLSRN
ncbi:hypothetical protein ACHMW7_27855 [Aminobacter sp. UC22_36]|uniref:hypothetical protein n=1 Tax=Aminobacter sp. UC22_36 TaxID=3374549 RepID=UPI0037564ACA